MASRFQRDPKNPGVFKDNVTGEVFEDVNIRSDTLHDTVLFLAGNQAAGTKNFVFRDIQNKDLQHTTLTQSKKIPENNVMKMSRVGVCVPQAHGNSLPTDADVMKLAWTAVMTFKLNSQEIVKGPLVKFPSGFGVQGTTNRNNTGIVSIGPTSQVAVPELEREQILTDKTELNTIIEIPNAPWVAAITSAVAYVQPSLSVDVAVQVHIGGIIEKPSNT